MPRHTVLTIIEGHALPGALAAGGELAEHYRARLAPAAGAAPAAAGGPAGARIELYAVGEAARIQRRLRPPAPLGGGGAAATGPGEVHALWAEGSWLTPGRCPPPPAADRGATAWQWAYYRAVLAAGPRAHLLLWDVHGLPGPAAAAA